MDNTAPSMSDQNNNIEAGLNASDRVEGYDRLGRLMGELPDTAIFRRFGALGAEDLLYRQAELCELERRLREDQREDKESRHEDRVRYARDWGRLQSSVDEDAPEGNDGSQLETILEIREKLKDYQEALLRYRQVHALGPPVSRQVKAVQEWMERPDMGNVFLVGLDKDIWKEPNLDDLVALAAPSEDNFTNSLTLNMIHLYNRVFGRYIHRAETRDFLQNTIKYTDEGTFKVLKTLSTLVASLVPMAAIAVLYSIKTMPDHLGAVAGFTALFSFSLSVITSAATKEIFAATAAFAAVLVVFIGVTESQIIIASTPTSSTSQ
ncbi:hypothetical protein B0H63DRAFT_473466 [Podospora didyma]|uniref:DUF6594 domain-containing protein n=1 Tax=Podospora didyma TaxID=330526 RepID=A0AAE0NQ88_9PEZI|nr:hypothetical protein B0H63DRAFT_473466 [Podospora didyma]